MFILDLFGYSGHIIGFLLFFGCIWSDLRLRNPPSPRPPPLGLCLKFYIPKLCEKWKRYEIECCIYIITVTSSCPKLLCSIRFQIAAEVWETTLAANKRTEWLVSTPTDAFSNTLHCIALHRVALHCIVVLMWGLDCTCSYEDHHIRLFGSSVCDTEGGTFWGRNKIKSIHGSVLPGMTPIWR